MNSNNLPPEKNSSLSIEDAANKLKPYRKLLSCAGHFLLAQFTQASKLYAQHKNRIGLAEAVKDTMVIKARSHAAIKEKMFSQLLAATPEEEIQLRAKIDYIEQDLQQLEIYEKALDFLPPLNPKSTPNDDKEEIERSEESQVWIDTFNKYARKKNEEWRKNLFAKALALEATKPGELNQQALWFLGTMDEETFQSLAALLDVAVIVENHYFLPNYAKFHSYPIPTSASKINTNIANHKAFLSESGLLASSKKSFQISILIAHYIEHKFIATLKEKIKLNEMLLSPLGLNIAKLYTPQKNALGIEIFNTWKEGMRPLVSEIIQET